MPVFKLLYVFFLVILYSTVFRNSLLLFATFLYKCLCFLLLILKSTSNLRSLFSTFSVQKKPQNSTEKKWSNKALYNCLGIPVAPLFSKSRFFSHNLFIFKIQKTVCFPNGLKTFVLVYAFLINSVEFQLSYL